MRNSLKLSVIDVVRKYSNDTTESVYSDKSIVSWGKDNGCPTMLRNCYEGSSTLKAAIDSSVNYVAGDGVQGSGIFAQSVNRNGLTMEDFVRYLASDYYVFGNFAFQVLKNAVGDVLELFPLDVAKCRLSGDGKRVFYNAKGWQRYSSKCTSYPRIGTSEDKSASEIAFYNAGGISRVYALPAWHSALNDVLTEMECAQYALSSVGSGFSARYILNVPNADNLTEEQQEAFETAIRDKFCGADKDVNFMLYWQQSGESGLTVSKIESDDTPERYIAIKDNARSNIFTSLRISPLLCGLSSGSSTGFATQEFSDSFTLFNRTVVSGVQRLIAGAINKAIGYDGVTIMPFRIDFNQDTK